MISRSLICGMSRGRRPLERGNRLLTRNHSSSISFDYYVLVLILNNLSYGAGSDVWYFVVVTDQLSISMPRTLY
jgi:hypothetical protein